MGTTLFKRVSVEDTINMYVVSEAGKNVLYPREGLDIKHKFSLTGNGRYLKQFKENLVCIVGSAVYLLNSSLAENKIGSLTSNVGLVKTSGASRYLIIVDGLKGWLFNNDTGTFTEITYIAFPTLPIDIEFLGDRFLAAGNNDPATGNVVRFSAIRDPTSWQSEDSFSMPANEEIVGMEVLANRLFLMGKNITQVWYPVGSAFPFRKESVDMEYGCIAPRSIANGVGILMWLGRDEEGVNSVIMTTGGSPRSVNSAAFSEEIENYSVTSDATAYIFKNALGHLFYQINFPTANSTWLYRIDANIDTKDRWTKLTYAQTDRHLGEAHSYFTNKHYILSYKDNSLYQQDLSYFDDNSLEIRHQRTLPPFSLPTLEDFSVNYVELDVNVGESLGGFDYIYDYGDDTAAKIYCEVSRNGGKSFDTPIASDLGKKGEFRKRVRFSGLGTSNNFVFRFYHFNRTPITFIRGSISIDK
jgi:hypothetical protein